jgi:hypothetical protein
VNLFSWTGMPENVSEWLSSRMRSFDLVILTLKKDYNNENLNPYRLGLGVWPLSNSTLFNTRLISA